MKTYPADFRERLLDAIDAGLPQHEAAQRFGVHRATLSRWAQRRCRTGSAAPTPRPGRARLLDDAALAAQVAAHADATLAEHCATWEATQGRRVSEATMSRGLTRIGGPLKKNAGRP